MRLATILLLCSLALLASCPRQIPAEVAARQGTATHPWELPGYQIDSSLSRPSIPEQTPAQPVEDPDALQLPAARGPAFSEEDTLVEADLPGQWLQVCVCSNEQLDLPPYEEMDILDLRTERTMTWHIRTNGQETQYLDGNWDKPGPGQVSLQTPGNQPVVLYGQLYNHNFLFLWSYEQKLGHWFVRFPETGNQRITRNRFKTTFGNMIFTEVGDLGFRGEVHGEYTRSVGGRYIPGMISMRWEETETRSAGYAAFLVSPDFSTLDGVWWLDDYEAAPFGGPWTGTADDSIAMPKETAPASEDNPDSSSGSETSSAG